MLFHCFISLCAVSKYIATIKIYYLLQSLGNHEFDNGVSGLTPFIHNLNCPVLAANLILEKVPSLQAETNLQNSLIIEIKGTKIGIIGYLTPETKVLAVHNDVEYKPEVPIIREEARKLKEQGIEIIIALGHSGYSKDLEIAKEVEELDLIIGGHTNTFLWNGTSPDSEEAVGAYPTYVKQRSGRLIPVVQAYAYTKYLGKLHMTFDINGEIISLDGTPTLLDHTIPQDPDVLKIVEKYADKGNALSNAIIGNTSVLLDALRCSKKECNLGNLITDAMVYFYASEHRGKYWTNAAISVLQAGGIRTSIAHEVFPASVTKGDLLTVLPFADKLVTITMNGTILIQMLEHAVANYNEGDLTSEFLQVSGLKVVYDVNKKPGNRVVQVLARCRACDLPEYQPIAHNKFYEVITTLFLANGGDGFAMLIDQPRINLPSDHFVCTERYIRQHSPIFAEVSDRLTILDRNNGYNIFLSINIGVISILSHLLIKIS